MKKTEGTGRVGKIAVEKELKSTSDVLLYEIIDDYRILENTTVTISLIKNEKDIQYGIVTLNENV